MHTDTTVSNSIIAKLRGTAVGKWIIHHDGSLIFNVLYIGLAVVLSLALGLFWLLVVVGVHGVLEFTRHKLQHRGTVYSLLEMLWELKLDIGIILFAFWLAVYFDFIFGMAGLSAAGRAVAQTGSRMAQASTRVVLWQRIIRGALITIDDFAIAIKQLGKTRDSKRKKGVNTVTQPQVKPDELRIERDHSSWFAPYTVGDKLSLAFGIVVLALIAIAPFITDFSYLDIVILIGGELKPFP